jgi:hypothetical protein
MVNRPPAKAMADKVSEMVEAVLVPADRVREADEPHSHVVRFGPDKPLRLDAGIDLSPFQINTLTYTVVDP